MTHAATAKMRLDGRQAYGQYIGQPRHPLRVEWEKGRTDAGLTRPQLPRAFQSETESWLAGGAGPARLGGPVHASPTGHIDAPSWVQLTTFRHRFPTEARPKNSQKNKHDGLRMAFSEKRPAFQPPTSLCALEYFF